MMAPKKENAKSFWWQFHRTGSVYCPVTYDNEQFTPSRVSTSSTTRSTRVLKLRNRPLNASTSWTRCCTWATRRNPGPSANNHTIFIFRSRCILSNMSIVPSVAGALKTRNVRVCVIFSSLSISGQSSKRILNNWMSDTNTRTSLTTSYLNATVRIRSAQWRPSARGWYRA